MIKKFKILILLCINFMYSTYTAHNNNNLILIIMKMKALLGDALIYIINKIQINHDLEICFFQQYQKLINSYCYYRVKIIYQYSMTHKFI